MQNQSCCFSGRREIRDMEYSQVQKRLKEAIISQINKGIRSFLVRGELGFDMMAALSVLSLKPKHPHIKLILMLPYTEQNVCWQSSDISTYKFILDNVDSVVYTSRHYHNDCVLARDRHFVDISRACVCYWEGENPEYIASYAQEKSLEIIHI